MPLRQAGIALPTLLPFDDLEHGGGPQPVVGAAAHDPYSVLGCGGKTPQNLFLVEMSTHLTGLQRRAG